MSHSEEPRLFWRKCTTCKKPIQFGQKYWICSVSTCNRARTDLVFCDLRCFDAHVPVLNHRDAGAFEKNAPQKSHCSDSIQNTPQPKKVTPKLEAPLQGTMRHSTSDEGLEILVVVSKVKAYIRSRAGMNTSDSVSALLTEKVRCLADSAIERAKKSGRMTVMDRDI